MEYKKQEIKEYFIESLRDIRYFNGWGAIQEMRDNCELHHEIFNIYFKKFLIVGSVLRVYMLRLWAQLARSQSLTMSTALKLMTL